MFEWFSTLFGGSKTKSSLTGSLNEEGFISKDLFYEILDLDNAIVMFFTARDGWIGANKAFFEFFPYNDISDFRNKHESIRELFISESEDVFTEIDKSWMDYIRKHVPNTYHVSIADKSGKEHLFRVKNNRINRSAQELYVLEFEDISELEQARTQMTQIEEMKSKFLANISHEFRTPMNGLMGFIELLEKSEPNDKQSEYLQLIDMSAKNLMSNIENLLDLAQMQNGRLVLQPSEFNLIFEMENIAHIYCIEGRNKGLRISFAIDPRLPAKVTGDLRKIKQVIINLLSNAIKFTKKHGMIVIEIKLLKPIQDGKCNISFSVKDTGKGIPKDHIALITKPFISGDQADNRLGVGLSLSHGLIELMGGSLRIQSEEDRGSTFSFALDFVGATEPAVQHIKNKRVKVALFDEKRVDEANLLTNYLRGSGLSVTKVNFIDDNFYKDTDMNYIIASQDDGTWLSKLTAMRKGAKNVLLLEGMEKVQTRLAHLVDYTLSRPLLPSLVGIHLKEVFALPEVTHEIDEIKEVSNIKALIAEDNLINQRLIKILLQEYSIDVVTAGDGEEAVQLCQNESFDIVFMDIDMPIKNGILATQEIKELIRTTGVKDLPIIALTALAMEGDRERIIEEGLDDYISKPLTRQKLESVLEKYLKDRIK